MGIVAWLARKVVQNHVPLSCFGVLLACFVTNASVLLPSPSIFIVTSFAMKMNPVGVVIAGAIGSALGEMTGYYLGKNGRVFLSKKWKLCLRKLLSANTYLWVFILAAVPLPVFDFIGILAGFGKLKPFRFYVCCFLGKLLKLTCYVLIAETLVFLKVL